MPKVPADFSPKSVYRYHCLIYAVKQIYEDSLHNYAEILDACSIYKAA